ncbi:MAG: phosphohistidine phosphatase [Halioglobus sp.]|jgi:phosphohistidine phosphatase
MIVTIVRHGQAGNAATDEARELTAKGIADIGIAGRRLHELCDDKTLVIPDRIFHSAWRRTTQTANILASVLAVRAEPFDPLLPQYGCAEVDHGLALLASSLGPNSHSLLVGHQPLVSQLVDHYLGELGLAPALPPGGLVCIDMDVAAADCGRLLFWAMPSQYEGSI